MVYAWELIVENALKVFPLEASVKPKRSSEGVPLVVVPQYPASPSTVDPLMFRSREIPHNAPGVALTVAGDVGKLNLRFDKGDGLKILDPVSSDLLQSHIDFVFEFRSAIVDVARYDQQGSRLPPEFVADHVADYLDSWLTSNPYAVISAIVAAGARRAQDDPVDRGFFVASGDQRPVGIVDGFADPRYGEFAIDGFTVAQYSELLKEINEGFVLRWRREANNPFLSGLLTYTTSQAPSDDGVWRVQVSGIAGMRFKVGQGSLTLFDVSYNATLARDRAATPRLLAVSGWEDELLALAGYINSSRPPEDLSVPARTGELTSGSLVNSLLYNAYQRYTSSVNGGFLNETAWNIMKETVAAADHSGVSGGTSLKRGVMIQLINEYLFGEWGSRAEVDGAFNSIAQEFIPILGTRNTFANQPEPQGFVAWHALVFTTANMDWAGYVAAIGFTPDADNTISRS